MAPAKDTSEDVRGLLEEADKMEGLGDAVARVTKSLGIPECSKCKKRRKWLNERVPFRQRQRRTLQQERRKGCSHCN
jgi:hypothetical protein